MTMRTTDLTMREKAILDALRLLDRPAKPLEQNFMHIISEYRASTSGLKASLEAVQKQAATYHRELERVCAERDSLRPYAQHLPDCHLNTVNYPELKTATCTCGLKS